VRPGALSFKVCLFAFFEDFVMGGFVIGLEPNDLPSRRPALCKRAIVRKSRAVHKTKACRVNVPAHETIEGPAPGCLDDSWGNVNDRALPIPLFQYRDFQRNCQFTSDQEGLKKFILMFS
jgi:hypothetical protein